VAGSTSVAAGGSSDGRHLSEGVDADATVCSAEYHPRCDVRSLRGFRVNIRLLRAGGWPESDRHPAASPPEGQSGQAKTIATIKNYKPNISITAKTKQKKRVV
jgi:hypothetical protein